MYHNSCPLCGNEEGNISFKATERLLGTRDTFNYGECSACKGVYLLDKISDFGPYYPDSYHCFDDDAYPKWKKYLLEKVYAYNFWGTGIIGKITNKVFELMYGHKPEQNICWIGEASRLILGDGKINKGSISNLSVLDLGCGSGGLLKQLTTIGFKGLTGVEPFGKPSFNGINFINKEVKEFILETSNNNTYDIIILSHVLEHLYDHSEIMKGLKKILSKNGIIVIAMPFTGKLYNKYKENRLSLDAPRHVIIHSIESFKNLIKTSGLNSLQEWYEQKGWDIFASEMYSWDISFNEINKFGVKDYDFKKNNMLANVYNNQKTGGSSVTFFITH